MRRLFLPLIPLVIAATPGAALAADDGFEVWLNPSVSAGLDDNTGVELETAQRFRDADDGRADTYFARLWINQDVADTMTLSGAIEQRANASVNGGGNDETRLIQQLSTSHGILRTRLRLEQRFVENADRMGLRLRPRLGVKVPVSEDGHWAIKSDAELLAELGLPDPDSLGQGDDFAAFMGRAVPEHLRRRALRKLWVSNPVLANLDGLVDHGEDYTDAATVIPGMQTAYQVGKGMMQHVLALAEQAAAMLEGLRPPDDSGHAQLADLLRRIHASLDSAVTNDEPPSEH